jgi:hypothetical protein
LSSGLVAKGIKDKKAIVLREFAGMIQDNSGLREVALRQAGKSHELWSNGPLPEVLILNTKFELAQQLAFLHAFLKDGYKSNLASGFAGVVVELLRARRITDAEELLRRNLALEAPRSFSEIVLWAKFLEQKGADYELYRALLKAALKADDRTRVAGAERREAINRLLQLALQEKYYSAIADRQPFFAKALLNNLSGLDVYIEALVFSPEMEEALDLAARDSVLNYAAAARALVAGKSNANDRKLIQETKGILAKTKVHQDILELERLNRAFSAVGRLKGTNMVSAGTVLLPLIQVADNAIDNAKRHAWTSLQAREAAKAASRAYAQNMAQILDALPLGTKIGTRNPKDLSARVRKKVLE